MNGNELPQVVSGVTTESSTVAVDFNDAQSRLDEEVRRAGVIAERLRTTNDHLSETTISTRAGTIAVLEVWSDILGNPRS